MNDFYEAIFQNSQGAPPSEKLVTGTKYGLENLAIGTEYGSQILVPEQNVSLRMGTGTKIGLTSFCSGTHFLEIHSVPVPIFERHLLFW